ncbi:hypothetical protein A9Q83_06760 [Alphaproteobacteria bacterium 46_93_T64]|nr:hypothetical protein A9Q83_06760 [Alphaproteobacteria bacterium 46_93_T64]
MRNVGDNVKRSFSVAGILICLAWGFTAPVYAEQKTVLIISFDNSDQGDITSTLYRDVVDRISKHIQKAGFQTTETAGLGGAGDQPSLEQEDEQLLSGLRKENKIRDHAVVIDYVAIVQIVANMVLLESGTQINVEIRGRMLRVENSDVLARFALPVPNYFVAPPSCDRNCVIELLQSNTAMIADGLGHVLGQRLKNGTD